MKNIVNRTLVVKKTNFNIAKNVRNSRSISALSALRKLHGLGLLLCALLVGSLQVWGGTYTYDFSTVTNKWYTNSTHTTTAGTGSVNNYTTVYYTDGTTWTASGTNHYFNSGYYLLGKSGAVLNLPTYSGEKITQVKLHGSSSHSTNVSVNIYTTGGTAASTAQTWSTTGKDHTYAINSSYQSSALRVQVTNAYNTQFTQIEITTTSDCAKSVTINKGTGTNCTFTLSKSGAQASCDGVSTTVTVSPNTGYQSPVVTQSGASAAPTITGSSNSWTVAYASNTTGTSTISVSCSAKQCIVTFDKNGGTDGTNSVTATYGSAMPSITPPTREHYTFDGYYDSESDNNGTGNKYYNSDGSSAATWNKNTTSNTTLYAKWTEHDLTNYRTSCTTSCDNQYSFHYGPHIGDWETPLCFTKTGTNDWSISNFTIPSHTNGEFYVGWGGAVNGQSVTKAWTDTWSESNAVGNGAMLLLPTSSSIVGQATGAKGTIIIWNNTSSKNQHVGFKPNGYGITYGGNSYAFAETATANKWETEMVTLPNVGSTTYTMGLATGTAGTYVTCTHSKAAENINVMGMSSVEGGKKKILLVPGSFDADGAVYAIWDGTNSAWGDGTTKLMTDVDGDGIWEGVVASTCVKINLVRLSSGTTASNISWDRKWNQTGDINVYDLLNKYTITSLNGNDCAYSTTAIHPTTGMNGKFRMWDNSGDNNWYVHFVPYYKLTYDANGGTGAPSAVNKNSEEAGTVAISSTEPTYSGYRFMGWATTAERAAAGTVDYKYGTASDEITLTGDQTLYAVWKQLYTVTYAYAGGSGSCSNGSYIQGETVTVCATDPTKPGCDFTGWSYSPSVTVTAGAFTMPASAVTITAIWTDHTYVLSHTGSNFTNTEGTTTIKSSDTPLTLHYTCTGSYGFPNNVTITGGGKATWTKDTHYTWTVAGDKKSATLVITPATTISANVDIAITMATTYTVTFVHHDKGTYSSGSTEWIVPSNDNTITLPTVTEVSCGFYDTFEGWIASNSEYAESDDKPATVYAGDGSYTVTGNVTLRALYSKCEGDGGQVYRKIASTGAVTAGTYILVSGDPRVYSSHEGTNAYGSSISGLTADGDDFTSTLPSGAQQVSVTLGTGDNAGKFAIYNAARTKYLTYSGSSNTLNENSDVVYKWTLTDGTETINTRSVPAGVLTPDGGTARVIQCNSGSSYRFACYTNNASYNHVFLYKLIDKCTKSYATNPSCIKPTGVHIVYNANALDATMSCSTSNRMYKVQDAQNKYPQLASAYSFCTNATRTGYTLVGWNTQANGLGTTYDIDRSYSSLPVSGDLDGDNRVTLNVYAMWASAVSFNLGNATGGTGVPAVVEEDGGFMLPEPTAAQIGTIPCGYSFYGWSESSVSSIQTKPTLFMPGTKYTGSYRTLYAVYRLAGEGGSDQYYFTFEYNSKTYCITRKHANYDRFVVEETTSGLEFGLDNGYLYYMDNDARVYVYWAGSSTTVTTTSIMPNNNAYKTTFVPGANGTIIVTPATSGRYLQMPGSSYTDRAYYTTSEVNPTLVEATSYTYATNPSCETTATLQFVINGTGGTLNYPDGYNASSYEDLTPGTDVYLPTANYPGEWVFEGWMKGSELPSQDYSPEGMSNFYTVTLNTTQYTASPAGTTTFYAVFSKTNNDKQFDPVNGGTYKIFGINNDATKVYMPVWGGSTGTVAGVTDCALTGEYTITPGTGDNAGQYKITTGTYTLGVEGDGPGQTGLKKDDNAWWDIEASTSTKGTWRMKIHGSSNRVLSLSSSTFGNYAVSQVNNPSQTIYRDMEIGECIYTEYTSTPENIPYITITGSPVKITSTKDERVYSPTKVHIEAHNFTGTRRINFSATNGFATNPTYVNCEANGSYSGDIDIYYEPTINGNGNIVTSVLTASQAAESVTQTFSAIKGRNLPQNFVIAVKSGTQWYALPDDCHSNGTPAAVPIEVNDPNAPTAASLVPHNVEWRLSDVVSTRTDYRDKVYFYEPNTVKPDDPLTYYNYTLYAGDAPSIQTYAQLTGVTGDNSYHYEWTLTTSDLCAYTISNADVGKNISINTSGNFGTHSQKVVSETLYLLPITAYYEPAEFQVVEWKANSVVIMYLGNASQASVQVGSNDEGSNQTLSSVKVDHGVYELAASGLTSASNTFQPLQIVFKNAGGTEIGRNYVTIPAIVSGSVATSAYESVKDLAESNDVVILKGGTLTTTGTNSSAYKFANVTVYGGGKLVVDASTHFSVTGSLVLRVGGLNAGAYDYVYPQLNLGSGSTLNNSSGNFYYEYLTNYTQWFHMVLPFDAAINTIKYPTEYYGSAVSASNHGSWVIRRYAGEVRATGNYDAWKNIEEDEPAATEVKAGKGYIFWGVPKKVTANGVKDRQTWSIQRITITKAAATAIANENADKAISGLSSYSGVSGNSGAPNDQGWNLIGNPFMTHLSGLSSTSIQVGKLVKEIVGSKWTGRWVWDDTSEQTGYRYITVPSHHFDTYEAKKTSEFDGTTDEKTLKAGRAFFVQIAGDATGITFAVANKQAKSRYSWLTQSSDTDVETGIVMSNTTLKDEVNFWIKDGKTAEYEFNADYPKTPNSTNFNIYGVHSHGDLSWVAISPEIAEGSMAIGYQVPAAGTYTLSMSDNYPANEVESLLVTDHAVDPEKTVDLIAAPYEFTVNQAETNNTRFTVSVKLKNNEPDNPENPGTGLEDVDAKNDEPVKFMYHEQLYILRNGVIYDGTGKKVREINK